MSKLGKRGRKFQLFSVTFTLETQHGKHGPVMIFVAIPKLMSMPTVTELEDYIELYGYQNMFPTVAAISSVGEFWEDKLPHGGCLIIAREDSKKEAPQEDFEQSHDIGPTMIRMDWRV